MESLEMLSHSNREDRPDDVICASDDRSGAKAPPAFVRARDIPLKAKVVDNLRGLEWQPKCQAVCCRVGRSVAQVICAELRGSARSELAVTDGFFAEAEVTRASRQLSRKREFREAARAPITFDQRLIEHAALWLAGQREIPRTFETRASAARRGQAGPAPRSLRRCVCTAASPRSSARD